MLKNDILPFLINIFQDLPSSSMESFIRQLIKSPRRLNRKKFYLMTHFYLNNERNNNHKLLHTFHKRLSIQRACGQKTKCQPISNKEIR